MKYTYNVREAQANLSKLCRENKSFVIANRDKPMMVALPIDEYEAMVETLDVLSDSRAMEAIRKSRAGEIDYVELDLGDEDFGLR